MMRVVSRWSRWRKCHLKYVEIRLAAGSALGELTHSTRSPSRNWGLYTCKGTEGREEKRWRPMYKGIEGLLLRGTEGREGGERELKSLVGNGIPPKVN